MSCKSLNDAALRACESIGLTFKIFPTDGEFHIVDVIDGKKNNAAGRIKLFTDGKGGVAHNWKTGQQQSFFLNGNNSTGYTSPEELERIKREQQKRAIEQKRRYDSTAVDALIMWQALKPSPPDHPYLVKKQIKPYSARITSWVRWIADEQGQRKKLTIENTLILPLCTAAGEVRSLQAIFPETHPLLNRGKDFLPGGQLAGLFWWIGARTETVLICEGFATAATLHEESGYRVYMAFTAGNLMAVGRIVREKSPNAQIIFCADNDTNTAGNPGLTKASAAAQAIGAGLAVPPIAGDFNDYAIFLKAVANAQ